MSREIAKLSFEGKLQAVAEEKETHSQTLKFGPWTAMVTYGAQPFGRRNPPGGNPEPIGRALVAQLGENEFLVTGLYCRVDFQPSDTDSANSATSFAWRRAVIKTVCSTP